MQPSSEKKIRNNKDIVSVRSRQDINSKNHVHYFSNNLSSAKEKKEININQKISKNNQQNIELELDHPEPLITDYDEDIYELKTQFFIKNEKNDSDNNEKLRDLSQKNEDKNRKNEIIYSNKKNISNDEYTNNKNMNNKSLIDREIKMNTINSDSKTKEEIIKNDPKFNDNEIKIYSTRIFDRRNNSSVTDSNYKDIEKDFKSSGKPATNENNNNGYTLIKSNSIIKNQNSKNKNIPKLKVYASTKCFNTTNINKKGTIRKLVYQESQKNNLKDIEKKICQNLAKKPPNNNVNKIYTNNQKPNLNINIKNNSQHINTQKKQILHKINEENVSNKENNNKDNNNNVSQKFNNKLNVNKNPFISFENFNNTKTTVVIFSKFKKIRPILKANVLPNCNEKNYQNINGQRSSTNIILNNSKSLYSEPYSFRKEKTIPNQRKKMGFKKSQNTKLLFLDKNNYGINFRNFIKSSMTENDKNSNDLNNERKKLLPIKNSTNKKQNITLPSNNYNYDYNYYYGNNTYTYDKNSIFINYNSPYIDNYNY